MDFELTASQIQLEGGFGDVDSDMDRSGLCFHIMANVLTHPYEYELSAWAGALATVRVWSKGPGRFLLGIGLAKSRPRVARTHPGHRRPLIEDGGSNFLPEQEKQKGGTKAVTKSRRSGHPLAGCCTGLATLAFVPQPANG